MQTYALGLCATLGVFESKVERHSDESDKVVHLTTSSSSPYSKKSASGSGRKLIIPCERSSIKLKKRHTYCITGALDAKHLPDSVVVYKILNEHIQNVLGFFFNLA